MAISITVMHVAGFSSEYGGNFIASLKQLCKVCKKNGYDFIAVFPEAAQNKEWCKKLVADNWKLYFLPKSASKLRCALHLAAIISKERVTIIHTHFVQYDLAAWLGALFVSKGRKLVSVVWHIHSELVGSSALIRKTTNFIKYQVLSHFVWLIPVADSVAVGVYSIGCPRNRVHTITNGIDFQRATTVAVDGRPHSLLNGVEPDNYLILMFGYSPAIKGVDIALDAISEIVKINPHVILGIVGTDKLKAFLNRRFGGQLPLWIRLIPPTENVGSIYKVASVFLSASRSEGMPYAVCEAMANGLPVILSEIPGVSWAHRTPGAVFFSLGKDSSSQLAVAISNVMSWTTEKRNNSANISKDLIRNEFSVFRWSEQVLDLYKKILGLHEKPLCKFEN